MASIKEKKYASGLQYWMMRVYDGEKMGCTECGETMEGSNTTNKYVWVVLKERPEAEKKDELDVYCPGCWEKEVD